MTVQLDRLDGGPVRAGAAFRVVRRRPAEQRVVRLVYATFAVGTVIGLLATTVTQPSTWSLGVLGVFCVAYLLLGTELDRT